MSFCEKTLIIKQTSEDFSINEKRVSGICRIENEDGVSTFFLSLINLKSVDNGNYFIYIFDNDNNVIFYDLKNRPISISCAMEKEINIKSGFACGLFYEYDYIPLLVAFGKNENCNLTIQDCKKIVAEKCLEKKNKQIQERKVLLKKNEEETIQKEEKIIEEEKQNNYNDEAVATEDFYLLEKELNEKLKTISEAENKTFSENNVEFYDKEKGELEELFSKFPHEENLEKTFPFSTWVKINYSSDKYYVVGVVKENDKEKYICYGVPSNYSENPPIELKGYCSFVPASLFDLKGKGYWMMFQDAVTGDCVHLDNN
ncbi:MAG: hypothetical protein MJ066_01540 [Clostridia bacterium]|nr:hypothetical protein [Clostridia bacterium]